MPVSPRTFLIELYEEYLEEAAFLYEQRRTLYSNPDVTWKKIGEFESRLEAHIDGLIVGEGLALDVCDRRAVEGEFGELYAAVSVFCRQEQRERVLATLDKLDPNDVKKGGAIADALKYELPNAWVPDFLTLLASGDPKLAPILARALGYRRSPCGPQLLTAMRRCSSTALPEVVWALGRVAYHPASEPLLDYLRSEDEPVRSAAALALARMGETRGIEFCQQEAVTSTWALFPIGLAGGRNSVRLLNGIIEKNGSAECLTALGLLGDPASIPLLISGLAEPAMAAAAAAALHCISGARLLETVFVPDVIDEEELFESEREHRSSGKTLDRGDGRPYGSYATRLSENPDDWNLWWKANATRFVSGVRYRDGGPLSFGRLTGMLTSDHTLHQLRGYCAEELATRYQNDLGIEIDMPVSIQMNKLAEAVAGSQAAQNRFEDGEWYFAGQRCP